MPIIESSVLVNRPARETYAFIKNLQAFPHFISGVEQVKVRPLSKRQAVSEWAIQVEGTPISWRERDTFEDDMLAIKFKMLDGDFASYSGEWRVLEDGVSSRVSLALSIDWDVVNLREEVSQTLERKAKLAVRWMLRYLRKSVGKGSVLSQYSLSDASAGIVSELVTYQNKFGHRIVGYYDHPKETPSGANPFVVIPPGYGETKRGTLSVAYYLAKNGFRVLRYDATNHVGESDGEILNATLSGFKDDLTATLDYVAQTFEIHRVGVVASSLAKRVAIKAAAEDKRIALLVGIVGVVDLQDTLRAVYKEDMIQECLEGKRWGVTDVLGFEVSGRFLETAIADRYHDLQSTKEDMSKLDIPVVFLVAENDVWVRLDQVKIVLEAPRRSLGEMVVIPEALHHLEENPQNAKVALKQIVASCCKYLKFDPVNLDGVMEPSLREIAVQNRIEKDRLRHLRRITRSDEKTFWEDYIGKYYILIKSPDFRGYLADVSEALGPLVAGEKLLDAGCGNGHLGAWLLQNAKRPPHGFDSATQRYFYIGVDFAAKTIRDAHLRHSELLDKYPSNEKPAYQHLIADLDGNLSFPEGTFAKICCSLVLSYLEDPLKTLRELMRVLQPGGRIVISSLKPHNDLSLVYRNFVDAAQSEDEICEGRRLLSSAGKIRQKESEGRYQFFSKTELVALLAAVGARSIQCRTSFGNQAHIASGDKGGR